MRELCKRTRKGPERNTIPYRGYRKWLYFLLKILFKKGKGLDLGAKPPRIKEYISTREEGG